MPHQRHKMCVELAPQTPNPIYGARHANANDVEGLAHLMLDAYRDTRLCLAVTEGNAPAQHVYNMLGFRIEESWVSG